MFRCSVPRQCGKHYSRPGTYPAPMGDYTPAFAFEPCRSERCEIEELHPEHEISEKRGRPLRGEELTREQRLERRRESRAIKLAAIKSKPSARW